VAPLEPWEKVIIDPEEFLSTIHGQISCIQCHGGVAMETEKESAHEGIVSRPSEDAKAVCGSCHPDVVESYAESLHATQEGYWTSMAARGVPIDHPEVEEMFGNHCATCHTTCGDCHISQPASVGGGLIDNHVFQETPSLTRNCTACHGSRVGKEYLGQNEGIMGDVHFRQARMACVSCHSGAQMHGELDTEEVSSRYDGVPFPTCESCHEEVVGGEDGNLMHVMHSENLSCQVCHSVSYSSCDGCHVALSEETGLPFFRTEGTYMTFFIGRNTLQDENRPYDYVTVRHVPISPDSYVYYGEDLMPDFNAVPTWLYATPHNIQLNTPQNESCDSCHGNSDLFLTTDKVAAEELEANQPVIVDTIPSLDLVSGFQ